MIPSVDVNNWAVLVGAVGNMILGMLWYGPFLGKSWVKEMGFTAADMEKAKKKSMGKTYASAFVSGLVMVYVLAMFVDFTKATTFGTGALTGFWLWLGFIATVSLGGVLWGGQSLRLYFINAAYYLVDFLILGGVLAVWI